MEVSIRKNKGRGKNARGSKKSRKPSTMSSHCCWICQLEDNPYQSQTARIFQTFCSHERFKPCLCKGSMQSVHKDCLNLWVQEKYTNSIKQLPAQSVVIDNDADLPDISCPNCKYLYNYIVKESSAYRFRKFKEIRWFSIEIVVLLTLLVFQVVLLSIDLYLSNAVKQERNGDRETTAMKISCFLHLSTVMILIGAACYNLLQVYTKEIKVEVYDKAAIVDE